MYSRLLLALSVAAALIPISASAGEWPYAGPSPDAPAAVSPSTYASVTAGTRTFRPVEPMPWGDVNMRVAPPVKPPEAKPEPPQEHPHH